MVLKSRYIRFVFVFLLLGATTVGGLLYLYFSMSREYSCVMTTRQVVVVRAATTLMPGTVLTLDHVDLESVPDRFLPPNPLRFRDLHRFEGRQLTFEVEAGAMLLDSDFD